MVNRELNLIIKMTNLFDKKFQYKNLGDMSKYDENGIREEGEKNERGARKSGKA